MNLKCLFVFFLVTTLLTACSIKSIFSKNVNTYAFSGNWQGNGVDAKGNTFSFAAEVIDLGGNRYRILIKDEINSLKEPFHTIDGVLVGNKFTSSADGGEYNGGGTLSKNLYEGYYIGPVNGTYTMWKMDEC